MRARVVLALLLVSSGAALGCTVHNPAPSPPDAGTDAHARDAGLAHDGGSPDDAAADAATVDANDAAGIDDTGVTGDAGHDAGADGGSDAGADAGSDAGSDGGRDAAVVLPGVLNETNVAAEADFCDIQFPQTTSASAGAPSEQIFGQIFEAGRTDLTTGGPAPGILAELGYGPAGTDPRTSTAWIFHPVVFNVEAGLSNNNDEYGGTLTIPTSGTYAYVYRFSFDGGANVTYCDSGPDAGGDGGSGSNGGLTFEPTQLGVITVL
jgi:hypothetical protein